MKPEFYISQIIRYFFGGLIVCVALIGCEKPVAKRHYTEIFVDIHAGLMLRDETPASFIKSDIGDMPTMQDSSLQKEINASADQTPLAWETPEGWVEKKGSGLRLATFTGTDSQAPVETTIVTLSGPAGGVSANVERWMRQLKIPVPDPKTLNDFIDRQERFSTVSGLPVVLVDLTQLQDDASADTPGMIAAVIEQKNAQIFVKMTGGKDSLLQNLGRFKNFVKSIRVKE